MGDDNKIKNMTKLLRTHSPAALGEDDKHDIGLQKISTTKNIDLCSHSSSLEGGSHLGL